MISVIIPVHNGIKTLDRAVESVMAQSVCAGPGREPVEVILVDDGSQEETARHCDELAEKGNPEGKTSPALDRSVAAGSGSGRSDDCANVGIRVFHMEDRGVSAARNLGLSKAQGEFITFLDDDDAMEPGMLEYLVRLQEKTGADICGCGFRKVLPVRTGTTGPCGADCSSRKENSRDTAGGKAEAGEERDGRENILPEDMADSGSWNVYRGADIVTERILQRDTRVWSKLFTREVIGEQRFLEGLTIGEDMLFVLSLVRDDTVYAAGNAALYDYTINPQGAMERPFTRSYMDQIRCWDEAEKVIRQNLPEVLEDPSGKAADAAASLGALRIVSDVLTASKIAKLPDSGWEEFQPEFRLCREKLREHRRIPGSCGRIPKDYRVKMLLLGQFPGVYRRLYRSHG